MQLGQKSKHTEGYKGKTKSSFHPALFLEATPVSSFSYVFPELVYTGANVCMHVCVYLFFSQMVTYTLFHAFLFHLIYLGNLSISVYEDSCHSWLRLPSILLNRRVISHLTRLLLVDI